MDQVKPTDIETSAKDRALSRESIFLSAVVFFASGKEPLTVRVRNISGGGMMIDCALGGVIGEEVTVDIKSIGRLKGRIAWAVAPRLGIAFDHEIDPKAARVKLNTPYDIGDLKKVDTFARRPGLAIR